MALKFRLVQRKVMSGKNAGKKLFFASPTSRGKISYERFCREVAEGSTVETADVKAVIDRMVRVLTLSGYERVNEEECKPQKPQGGGGTPQGGSPSGEDSGEGI